MVEPELYVVDRDGTTVKATSFLREPKFNITIDYYPRGNRCGSSKHFSKGFFDVKFNVAILFRFFFLLCKMSTKGQINFISIFFMLILGLLVLFRMYF